MSDLPKGVHFTLSPPKGTESIISTEAIEFLAVLHRTFDGRRKELLENRNKVQADLDSVRLLTSSLVLLLQSRIGVNNSRNADDKGKTLSFLKETEEIRNNTAWSCAPPAPGLEDRR
jgi:malate synthase